MENQYQFVGAFSLFLMAVAVFFLGYLVASV